MTCHSCVKLIENTLGSEPGVAAVNVSLGRKEAIVQYSESQTSTDVISTVIYDMGFDVEKIMDLAAKPQTAVGVMTPYHQPSVAVEMPSVVTVSAEGMVCMSCVNNIHTNIGAVVGVEAMQVFLGGGGKSLLPAVRSCCDYKKASVSKKGRVTVLPKMEITIKCVCLCLHACVSLRICMCGCACNTACTYRYTLFMQVYSESSLFMCM